MTYRTPSIERALGNRHAEDIEQYVLSLGCAIKDAFPMNGVPPVLLSDYGIMRNKMDDLMSYIKHFMSKHGEQIFKDYD